MFAYFVWLVFGEFDKWGIKEISEEKQTTPVIKLGFMYSIQTPAHRIEYVCSSLYVIYVFALIIITFLVLITV